MEKLILQANQTRYGHAIIDVNLGQEDNGAVVVRRIRP